MARAAVKVYQNSGFNIVYARARGVWKDVWNVWKKASTNKYDRRLEYIGYVVYFAVFGYSVFLPLKLNTIWFHVGLFIYLLGVIIDFMRARGYLKLDF